MSNNLKTGGGLSHEKIETNNFLMIVLILLVLLAGVTSLPSEPWWKQSKLIPPFQSLALWLRTQIPSGLAAQVKFPELTLKR